MQASIWKSERLLWCICQFATYFSLTLIGADTLHIWQLYCMVCWHVDVVIMLSAVDGRLKQIVSQNRSFIARHAFWMCHCQLTTSSHTQSKGQCGTCICTHAPWRSLNFDILNALSDRRMLTYADSGIALVEVTAPGKQLFWKFDISIWILHCPITCSHSAERFDLVWVLVMLNPVYWKLWCHNQTSNIRFRHEFLASLNPCWHFICSLFAFQQDVIYFKFD